MNNNHYDLIVVGSGPGGAALAQRLAPTAKRILILERGDYLPREEKNWDPQAVFVDGAYQADETWTNAKGDSFSPRFIIMSAATRKSMARRCSGCARDFGEVVHAGGVSPAWPIGYDMFEPYYTEAERLFHVHGARGEDPSEPWSSAPYPHPAVSHEPRVAKLADEKISTTYGP